MKNSLPEDDGLDTQLRAHFSAPALVDNGFSERVLIALPASRLNSFRSNRLYFCVAGLALGILISGIGLMKSWDFESALGAADHTLTLALGQLLTVPVALATSLAVLSLALAFRGQRLLPRL